MGAPRYARGVRAAISVLWIAQAIGCGDNGGLPASPGSASAPPPPTPQANLDVLRRYIAGRDALDGPAIDSVLAAHAIGMLADPSAGVIELGRDTSVGLLRKRRRKTTCELELAIVSVREAFGVVVCRKTLVSTKPPLERPIRMRQIYELGFTDDGKIARATLWYDSRRAWAQGGVANGADARPDIPTGRVELAIAQGTVDERTTAEATREIITAVTRGDRVALTRMFARDYIHHRSDRVDSELLDTPTAVETRLAGDVGCDARALTWMSSTAAGAWIAVRFGRSCRIGELHSFGAGLWLMKRNPTGQIVEGWEVFGRDEAERLLDRFSNVVARKLQADQGM